MKPEITMCPADIAQDPDFIRSVRRVNFTGNNVATFFFGQERPPMVVQLVS
ncbi:MAG: hypothetical protein Q8P12_07690 [bacterium]|nr:hypothetical protein [bacterium]